jgi:hypothetical protein
MGPSYQRYLAIRAKSLHIQQINQHINRTHLSGSEVTYDQYTDAYW